MPKLDFIYFDAGGGHRAAANALKAVIEQQSRPWEIRLVNLQEVLDPLDIFRKYTRIRLQDIYNLLLKKGWTLGSPQLAVAMHAIIRIYHRGQVRLLRKFWAREAPDVVVSLVPNFNRALATALHDVGGRRIPLVTILTDFADYPPHFWMEPLQPQTFICGTDKAVEQALTLGHPRESVHGVSGMILRPKFYEPPALDRAAERQRLGLKPDVPTGLVLFGGEGSSAMLDIARRVRQDVQLLFLCGKNDKLRRRIDALQLPYPFATLGFTTEVPFYMALSDFFIGKPGPGSISEALAMHLPVIVERNAWTLPQERYNADWVREKEVGVVLSSFREINAGLTTLLAPENFALFRANAVAIQNRAVFEIADILETLLPPQT